MLKEWKIEYVCVGIEAHQPSSRNISRLGYVKNKLHQRIAQLNKTYKETCQYGIGLEVSVYIATLKHLSERKILLQVEELNAVKDGLNMRLRECKSMLGSG